MKILLIIHHYLDLNAGAPGVTLKLGHQYQQFGHDVQYYSFDNLPKALPQAAKGALFPEFVAAHLTKLVQQGAVDIVEASTGDAWMWGMLQGRVKRRPLLATQSHGLEHICHLERLEEAKHGRLPLSWKYPIYHGGFRLWEVATSLRSADVIFLLNRRDANYAIAQLGIQPDRIHVVPNGISEKLLNLPFAQTPEALSSIGIAQIGSYIDRKGIQYGVPALNSVLSRYPQVHVSFLGTGCSLERVHADFDPAVRDRVHVIPHYSNEQLPDLLQGHFIKLLPSLAEGFGLALVEAMACGLAPIATAVEGPKEIVTDGYDGILVPSRNQLAIENTIERLICDRDLLDRVRKRAYATAQHYSWVTIAQQRLSVYEKINEYKD